MQHKISLLLFGIIAVLFVEINEATTTKNTTTKKPTVAEKKKLPTQAK
jgi:hypothetical protein